MHITVEIVLLHTEVLMTYVLKEVVREYSLYRTRPPCSEVVSTLQPTAAAAVCRYTWRGPSTNGASAMKRLRMTSKSQYPPACTRSLRSIAAKLLIAFVTAFRAGFAPRFCWRPLADAIFTVAFTTRNSSGDEIANVNFLTDNRTTNERHQRIAVMLYECNTKTTN